MKNFEQIRAYADVNGINYVVYNEKTEICPCADFHMEFLDINILEIPCTFQVTKAIVLCMPTPSIDDDGREYGHYYTLLQNLLEIEKPQYVGIDKNCIKFIMFCDWVE